MQICWPSSAKQQCTRVKIQNADYFKERSQWSYFRICFKLNAVFTIFCRSYFLYSLIHSHLDHCEIRKQNIIHSIQMFTVLFASHAHLSSLQTCHRETKINFSLYYRNVKKHFNNANEILRVIKLTRIL